MTSKKAFAIGLGLLALGASAPLPAAPIRIELAGSFWKLSPFTTPIEEHSEKLIRQKVYEILGPILPYIPDPEIREDLSLGSSGGAASATLWIPLFTDRLEAGLRCSVVRFRVPFTLTVEQSYSVLGYELVHVDSGAEGRVRLNSFAAGLLGRWTFLQTRRFRWSLTGGVTGLVFEGDLKADLETTIRTPLGSLTFLDGDEATIDELRDKFEDIPSCLFFPYLSTACEIRISRRLGIILEAAVSQGMFLSVGIAIGI